MSTTIQTPKTYLEFSEPGSAAHKFYEVQVKDSALMTRFGRIGARGRILTKKHASPEKAEAAAQKKIKEKLREGYVNADVDAKALHQVPSSEAVADVQTRYAIHADHTTFGDVLYLSGSSEALGEWTSTRAIPLSARSYPTWSVLVTLPPAEEVTFKLFSMNKAGEIVWESGPNRTLTLPKQGQVHYVSEWRA